MPSPAYMKVTGVTQNNITEGANSTESMGNQFQSQHADECLVIAFEHVIDIPTDPSSGQPSGKRVHNGMTVTKRFDKSSPLLYNSLCSGERLDVELTWYRTSEGGTQELYFSHKLEDATIVNIRGFMPNTLDPKFEQYQHHEEVTFSYRKITWNHTIANTEGHDDYDLI